MKTLVLKEGKMSYLAIGQNSPIFLLAHNAGGNHEMMQSLAAHLSTRGKVLIPDLMGHGASDSPKIEYTVKFFAQSLIELCHQENCTQILFIGLNYGASIGIEMIKIAPHLISKLILLDPAIFMEPWIASVVKQQIKELENSKEGLEQELVSSVIIKGSDEMRNTALNALKSTPSFVKASIYKHLLSWDKSHHFTASTPTLMIQASLPFCTEEKVRTVFSNLQVGRVVGSGPWVVLEVPSQVNAMIDRFLDTL